MICFLDVDGVLANFVEGTYRAFGKKYDYVKLSPNWNYFKEWDLSFEEFDAVCTTDFWAGLRWMHDGREILRLVEKTFGPENIYLLSSPMPNSQSATGKMLWIQRHLPQYIKRTIITQTQKGLFAKPDRVLIDDRNENVWGFRQAGGQAILVPRPWNEERDYLTISYVKDALSKLGVKCPES